MNAHDPQRPRTLPPIAPPSETARHPGSTPPPPRRRRWLKALVAIVLGLVAGLAIAEAVFWFRDEGAFPHVNIYVADDELGVRMEPGASQRLQFRDNPVTEIRVNSDGYRGADWPATSEGEVLVVGDSQVFGLGVEENETLSAALAEIMGRPVLNGGVPTYGPLEYNAVIEEVLDDRDVSTVVYVVNVANDLFEWDRPNRLRHAVWDGWAVRAETAPETITVFPGRSLLYQKSHLFYAIRRLAEEQAASMEVAELDERVVGLPSEGTWRDLVESGRLSTLDHRDAEEVFLASAVDQRQRLSRLDLQLDDVEGRIDRLIYEHNEDAFSYEEDGRNNFLRVQAARGRPGDIVREEGVEEGREIALTARIIRQAVRYRDRMLAQTRASGASEEAEAAVSERERLEAERAAALGAAVGREPVPSVLAPRLAEALEIVRSHDAELVVVALPLDVMVSADEWAKYDEEPVDMESTRILIADLVDTARRMGVRAVDPTDALREAEPGAFLDGDLHLTAKGQRALAGAVAAAMEAPAPLRVPNTGIPDDRSRVPAPEEWIHTPEAIVRGSSAARCETTRIREWLRVSCIREGRRHVPSGIEVVSGGLGEALTLTTRYAATLVAPIFPGQGLEADFFWEDRRQRLIVGWPEGEESPDMHFEEPVPGDARPYSVDEGAERVCACHLEVYSESVCEVEQGWPTGACSPTCETAYGRPVAECIEAYAERCEDLLRCVRGDPLALPPCPEGSANAGATGHCFVLCNDDRPCESGRCTPWQGAEICRP